MRLLTTEDIEALKIRGFIQSNFRYIDMIEIYRQNTSNDYNILKKMNEYMINPDNYITLFVQLDNITRKNLLRYICLNWHTIAESLDDCAVDFKDKPTTDICEFFVQSAHRVYFFIEIVYQYFFP